MLEEAKNQAGYHMFFLKDIKRNDFNTANNHSFALAVIQSYPIVVSQLFDN